MSKSNITTIIPIHSVKDDTMVWFKKAVDSVKNQQVKPDELLIVRCPCKDVISEVESFFKDNDYSDLNVRVIENNEGKDYCTQVNTAVKNVNTDYFSVLELDDEYATIWIKNAVKYIQAYPDVSLFLPIIVDVDAEGKFQGTTNEVVWANQFSNELGILDNESLLSYEGFNPSGMVCKKDVFLKYGGLKKSIILTFNYEFLLRLTYNDERIMTIPKFGYKHTNLRDNSLFSSYKNEHKMSHEEGAFWMDTARKEFYFSYDRPIQYEAN